MCFNKTLLYAPETVCSQVDKCSEVNSKDNGMFNGKQVREILIPANKNEKIIYFTRESMRVYTIWIGFN